jgi:DNA helicase-2/ATP-dependent DNA helicase PcrA
VSLITIHGAKGKEIDHVNVIGLAEGVLPSFQSVKAGENSAEMEEERHNSFVAITRAREWLCLSYADRYRGWAKRPSRFLEEMKIVLPLLPIA